MSAELLTYERLEVYALARTLAKDIYLAAQQFPDRTGRALTIPLQRAAISIPSNIAEGSSRTSGKDKAHFTQIAYGSRMEVACQLEFASDLGFLSAGPMEKYNEAIARPGRKLSALRAARLRRNSPRHLP